MRDFSSQPPAVSVRPVRATDPNIKFLAQVADSDDDDHAATGISAADALSNLMRNLSADLPLSFADALELMINEEMKEASKLYGKDHLYGMETVKRSILGSLS